MNFRKTHVCLIVLIGLLVWGCSKKEDVSEQKMTVVGQHRPPVPPRPNTQVCLQMHNRVGNLQLEFYKQYTNDGGEQFLVNTFKYYLSNIVLIYDTVRLFLPNTYFLVDHQKAKSSTILLPNIPKGNLIGIEMLIGVDAPRNSSGAQTGALDPILGMFWTWNSGYVMAKLEGKYTSGSDPNALFIWHCGGFNPPYSSIRKINLSLPVTTIDSLQQTVIDLNADVLEWFKTPHQVFIDSVPVFNDPSPLSVKVADNYADMITVDTVRSAPF